MAVKIHFETSNPAFGGQFDYVAQISSQMPIAWIAVQDGPVLDATETGSADGKL